jgi:hypothetical protein
MKIAGVEIAGELSQLNTDVLVLPRGGTEIVIKAQAIADMEEFKKRCPEPTPPVRLVKGGQQEPHLTDKTYIEQLTLHSQNRVNYIALMSLQDMEWDTVDLDEPKTWNNWETDLKHVGFTQHECNLVLNLCFDVNQLNEAKIQRARDLFLRGQGQVADNISSQSSEQNTSPFGEHVNDLE